MTDCPFTPFVGAAGVFGKPLEQHLNNCPSCRIAFQILAAVPPHPRTALCPDVSMLVAYDHGLLQDAEAVSASEHVEHCGYCLENLRLARQADLAPMTPQVALRDAHSLLLRNGVRRLTDWLVQHRHPAERDAVDASYDLALSLADSGTPRLAGQTWTHALGLSGPHAIGAAELLAISIRATHLLLTNTMLDEVASQLRSETQAHPSRRALVEDVIDAIRATSE